MKVLRHGYLPTYEKLFKTDLDKLQTASEDVRYLLNRGMAHKGMVKST